MTAAPVTQDDVEKNHGRYKECVRHTFVARMNEVAFPGAVDPKTFETIFESPADTFLMYRGLLTQPGWRQLHVRLEAACACRAACGA